MDPELEVQRKFLVRFYRRYLDADRNWTMAVAEARSWFPATDRPTINDVGEPGSPIRRLYESRERALHRLLLARKDFDVARHRVGSAARRGVPPRQILLISR